MPTSKKTITINNSIDLITTNYNDTFINNINRSGRKQIDYYKLDDISFDNIKNNKIKRLTKKTKVLDKLSSLNKFNYYITISTSKKYYYKLTDRLRKADKNMKFLSLASWSIISGLHYHILINTLLSKDKLEKKFKKIDNYDIQLVTNQRNLIGYFRKNIVKDIVSLLNSKDPDLKDKQIEILRYKNIISSSKNLIKPIVKKLDPSTTLEQLIETENAEYLKTIEAKKKGTSTIRIDKMEKNT